MIKLLRRLVGRVGTISKLNVCRAGSFQLLFKAQAPSINDTSRAPEYRGLNQTLTFICICVFPFMNSKWSVEFPELKKKSGNN